MNRNPVMELEEEYFNSAVNLVVTYQKTRKLSARFDEIVGLGLQESLYQKGSKISS